MEIEKQDIVVNEENILSMMNDDITSKFSAVKTDSDNAVTTDVVNELQSQQQKNDTVTGTIEQKTEPQNEKGFDISLLKNQGIDVVDLDDLKAKLKGYIEYEAKIKDNEAKLAEKDSAISELSDMLDKHSNPLSFFENEDEYKLQQIKKQSKDLFPNYNSKAITEIMTNGSNLTDLQVLILNEYLESKHVKTDADAKEVVYEDLRIEEDLPYDDWSSAKKIMAEKKARAIREKFEKIKTDIKLPEKISFTEKYAKSKEEANQKQEVQKAAWTDKVDGVINAISKYEDKDNGFTFDIDDEYKNYVRKELVNTVVNMGIEPTAENITNVSNTLQWEYLKNNHSKFLKLRDDYLKLKWEQEAYEKKTNPSLDKTKTNIQTGDVYDRLAEMVLK
jgi:uncharacterized coiled-coil protein SlyX